MLGRQTKADAPLKEAKSSIWSVSLPLLLLLLLLQVTIAPLQINAKLAGSIKVVYAVNAGGPEHVDQHGIRYEADPLQTGIASDYGNNLLMIGRVAEQDEVLYRTERYHTSTFGYEFQADGDGDYALIMKFCEVYFQDPNMKIFDIVLNGRHTIVSQLDIFREVGHGTAHEEIAYFRISNNRLHLNGESSELRNGRLRLDFIKGMHDNPKINAFALLKGDVSHLPQLPPIDAIDVEAKSATKLRNRQQAAGKSKKATPSPRVTDDDNEDADDDDDDMDDEDEHDFDYAEDEDEIVNENQRGEASQQAGQKTSRKASGPRHPDPYVVDDSSVLLPIVIAIGAFIPLLFCLCKL